MSVRALRGAITVPQNSREAILAAAEQLLRALVEANGLEPPAVVSAVFSTTPDLVQPSLRAACPCACGCWCCGKPIAPRRR